MVVHAVNELLIAELAVPVFVARLESLEERVTNTVGHFQKLSFGKEVVGGVMGFVKFIQQSEQFTFLLILEV